MIESSGLFIGWWAGWSVFVLPTEMRV